VSQYWKGKTNLDFTEARDSEGQWHQLGHMQVCISPETDNHASTPPLKFFYRPDALPAAQPTASKHCRQIGKSWQLQFHIFFVLTYTQVIFTRSQLHYPQCCWNSVYYEFAESGNLCGHF